MDSTSLLELCTELSGLVNTYGMPTVATSTVLGVLLYKLSKLKESIKSIAPLACNSKLTVVFPTMVKANSEVIARLRHLRADLKADRVLIFQYHNGGHNLSGVDFAKMSCTHEVVKPGLKTVQPELLNLPVAAFISLTECAFGVECGTMPSVSRLKNYDISTYSLFKDHSVKSAIIKPLTDVDENIFGFVLIEFCTKYVRNFGTPELKVVLPNMVERLSSMLELQNSTTDNQSTPN